jgi:Zn finger protein HypA/HybF involved in hydrogenase expression
MPMLIKCAGCGKEISKNAMICPHCKSNMASFKKKETKPCRVCNTPLVVVDHLSIVYKSDPGIIDGNPVSSSLKYTPCPKCGEPRPILQDNQSSSLKPFFAVIILLTIAGIVIAAYLKYFAN